MISRPNDKEIFLERACMFEAGILTIRCRVRTEKFVHLSFVDVDNIIKHRIG